MSPKKSTKKTAPAKKKVVAKKAATKASGGKKETKAIKNEEQEKLVLGARKRKETPSIFKVKSRKVTPIVFSLDDVQGIIKKKSENKPTTHPFPTKTQAGKAAGKEGATAKSLEKKIAKATSKKSVHGAASISDILGFNPNDKKSKPLSAIEEEKIEKRFLPFYKSLLELRKHFKDYLDLHTRDTLKRSPKDDTGDLSGYSQHMADAGTDTFDRDFALSLLSNEQDALFEIEEAIQRILHGGYGVCEITGKSIARDRLKAVPFTRYSLEGQEQLEATQNNTKERGGIFAESSLEESTKYTNLEAES